MASKLKDNRTILLTGMGGVFGEGLSRGRLSDALGDAQVVLAGRTRPKAWHSTPFIECDLGDAASWRRTLDEIQPDAVLYAAALARIDQCEAAPELALRIQRDVVTEWGEWRAGRHSRLVYISTDQVFDGRAEGYDELHAAAPLHAYGRSKLQGEQCTLQLSGVVVRLPLLLGPRVSARQAGADTVAIEAASAGRRLGFFTDEFRAPADPAYFAEPIARLLLEPHEGIFHLAGSEWVSRWRLADRACRAAGVEHGHERASLQHWQGDPRPPHLALRCTRARRELGFRPPDLRQSLARLDSAP